MVEHVNIADPDIHEPKGASTANAGQVYVADGAASGDWEYLFQYAGIHTLESDAVTVSTIGTTQQTFPFSNDGPDEIAVSDSANNRITLTEAGVYFVLFSISFSTNASGDSGTYEFKMALDGSETGFGCQRDMSGSSDAGSASVIAMVTATAGQQLTVLVESDNGGDTDDIDVYAATLKAFKVG